MKIQYKFATETVTIEVDDRWGELLVDLNRQEYNNDHKETRRHSSMDALAEQGVQFAAEQDALAALFQEPSRTDMLREAVRTLKPEPKRMSADSISAIFSMWRRDNTKSPAHFSIKRISSQNCWAKSFVRMMSTTVSSPAIDPTMWGMSMPSNADAAALARPGMVFSTMRFCARS